MTPSPEIQRGVNKWAARIVPVFLAGIVGYVTWVYLALLAVNYLIHPPRDNVPTRLGAGIALIVIYCILFLLMTTSYLRILQVIATNPGYVPRPSRRHRRKSSQRSSASSRASAEHDEKHGEADNQGFLDRTAVLDGRVRPPPGLSDFYSRDVFECDIDGLPRWCSSCQNWKPDRSHHSSEVGRCVYKMDHFCPWAGGLVSETNFNFFIQFCVYASIFCLFILITTAYYFQKGDMNDLQRPTWIIMLALAGLFMLFALGMAINSLNFAFENTTTVDNLTRSNRTQHFAVYAPQLSGEKPGGYDNTPRFGTVTYPLGSIAGENVQRRTFAILATPSGNNSYRVPLLMDNFRQVMGNHWWDWLLPIRHSPCTNHGFSSRDEEAAMGSSRMMYPISPILQQMKQDAGLQEDSHAGESRRKHRRRHSRHPSSEQDDHGSSKERSSRGSRSVH